jgi:hypothetical protein
MTADLSIIGIVFAIILFIIFFAAVTLYLSFRIKETFREEKKRGMLVVKIAFLIGILFLAGGSLYFFAKILSPTNGISPSNGDQEQKPELSMIISYPTEVTTNNQFTVTFTITNPTDFTAHDVLIQASSIFEDFTLISSSHDVTGNIIEVGNLSSGSTIVSL